MVIVKYYDGQGSTMTATMTGKLTGGPGNIANYYDYDGFLNYYDTVMM